MVAWWCWHPFVGALPTRPACCQEMRCAANAGSTSGVPAGHATVSEQHSCRWRQCELGARLAQHDARCRRHCTSVRAHAPTSMPHPGSPAVQVLSIDEQSTTGWNGDQAAQLLRGRSGSSVSVRFARRSEQVPGVPGRPEPVPHPSYELKQVPVPGCPDRGSAAARERSCSSRQPPPPPPPHGRAEDHSRNVPRLACSACTLRSCLQRACTPPALCCDWPRPSSWECLLGSADLKLTLPIGLGMEQMLSPRRWPLPLQVLHDTRRSPKCPLLTGHMQQVLSITAAASRVLSLSAVKWLQVSMRREKLEFSPVFARNIPHRDPTTKQQHMLGYIRLANFSQKAAHDMDAAIHELQVCCRVVRLTLHCSCASQAHSSRLL